MSLFSKLSAAAVLLGSSSIAFAHEGHDHAAWDSALQHALFYGAIAALVVFAGYRVIMARKVEVREEDKQS